MSLDSSSTSAFLASYSARSSSVKSRSSAEAVSRIARSLATSSARFCLSFSNIVLPPGLCSKEFRVCERVNGSSFSRSRNTTAILCHAVGRQGLGESPNLVDYTSRQGIRCCQHPTLAVVLLDLGHRRVSALRHIANEHPIGVVNKAL